MSRNTQVIVYVEKLNNRGVVVIVGDVVAPTDGEESVGNEVVVVIVSEYGGSDTESNEGSSESGSKNDNEDAPFEDREDERAIAIDDDFDNEDEPLFNLILKKKGKKRFSFFI